MPPRILTDEHISPRVAHDLTALGYDVVCVRDRGLLGRQDWDLMPWCIREQRAICTKNGPHFEREHRRCQERGEEHYGVLVVGEWTTDEIFWSLRQYLASDPEPPVNQVIFLSKASSAFIQRESGS